ncbi:MAG: transglutaminase-like domain-containing protein [Candidatus Woesearchaeota archaeon]|nr:transglutaminase-like domain-containing protein [Candidatus Woesearchaeota archaeon]
MEEKSLIEYVTANISFFPKSTKSQSVSLSIKNNSKITDCCILFRWISPSEGRLFYEINAEVVSNRNAPEIKSKVPFPIIALNEDMDKYVENTTTINFDAKIRDYASEIAEGSGNLFEATSRLAFWVYKNVKYDLSYGNEVKDAKWVFENKKGTCDEMASLFIAMCRSIGIPARYASGIAYSNIPEIPGFGNHGWAEVYFPNYGWIPFDPTYGQFGYTDASHIKFIDSEDTLISPIRYSWKGYGFNVNASELKTDAEVLNASEEPIPLIISTSAFSQIMDIDSFNLIIAEVYNPTEHYANAIVRISESEGLELLSEKAQHLVLSPYEAKKAFFIVRGKELESDSIYTIPVVVYSGSHSSEIVLTAMNENPVFSYEEVFNEIEKNRIEGETEYSGDVIFSCGKNEFYQNESGNFNCTFRNAMNKPLKNLNMCIGKNCSIANLAILEEQTFEFTINSSKTGRKKAVIAITNSDISLSKIFDYQIIEKPKARIRNIEYSNTVYSWEIFSVNFTVERTFGEPKNITISLEPAGITEIAYSENVEKEIPVIAEINPKNLKPGLNYIRIIVKFADDYGKNYSESKEIEINIRGGIMHWIRFSLYKIEDFIRGIF